MTEPLSDQNPHLVALLDFYVASGVDMAMDESPHTYFDTVSVGRDQPNSAQQAHQSSNAQGVTPPTNRSTAATHSSALQRTRSKPRDIPLDEAVSAARAQAADASTLEELRHALERFDGCNLKQTAKSLVFGSGHQDAAIMLIGEAPGRDEDQQGIPFVGRSGRLLDKMLKAIDLEREAVYITNTIPWRPPGNRTPSPIEQEICAPFIRRHIELVNPDILVFLGAASAKLLTGRSEGILKLRGRWFNYESPQRKIKSIATLHPAYLLRQPIQKRLAWQDFQLIKSALLANKTANL